jgi:hypothetical protein
MAILPNCPASKTGIQREGNRKLDDEREIEELKRIGAKKYT